MDDSIEEYQSSLEDLTFNSKPHINMLTILADENKPNAENIVKLIEAQLYKAAAKLPILYLLDSIVKNVGENYNPLFAKNIVNTFRQAFQTGNEKQKMSLYKLRTTWDEHFPLKKLHALDLKIHTLDPNWPVKPLPAHLQDGATNIHVNPKFIKRNEPVAKPVNPVVPAKAQAKTNDVDKIREQMIRQQKELLDLQQRKLMLELEQTKQELEAKQKEMHVQVGKHEKVARDPRLKSSHAAKVPAGGLRVTVKNKPSGPPMREKQSAREPKLKTNGEHTQKVKPGRPSPSFPNKQEAAKIKASLNVPKKRSPKIAPKKIKKSISPALDRPGSRSEMHSIHKPVPKTVEPKPKASIKETKKLVQPSDEHPLEKLLPVPNEQRDAERRKKRTYRNKPRSPSPPPPKLARRSSSPAPIRQISPDASVRRDPRQFGNENRRIRAMKDTQPRDSSRSSEGSLSPRFSPEPEANDPSKSSQWKPPPKRIRQQNDEPRNPPMRLNTESKLEIPQELTLSHQNEILRQADRQLQSGQLSHEQHQELLKQLHQLFELQRIRKIQFEEDDDHRRKDNNLNRRGFVPVHPQRGGRRPIHPRNMAEDDPRFRDRPHGPPMHNNRRLPPDHHFGRGRGLPGRGRPFRNHSPQSPRKNGGPINDPRIRREERPKFAQNEEFPPHHFNRSPMRAEERREHHRSLSPHRSAAPPDEAQKRQSDDHHKNLRKYAHSDQNRPPHPNMHSRPDPRGVNQEPIKRENENFGEKEGQRLEEPEDYIIAGMRKDEPQHQNFEEPEDYIIANMKEESPPCEEPEDFIIANMPPISEDFAKQSSDEKAYLQHMKKIKESMYSNNLKGSVDEKMEESDAGEKGASGTDTDADLSSDKKKNEDVMRSPSLPLKKRRYVSSDSEEKKPDETKNEEPKKEKNEEQLPQTEQLDISVEKSEEQIKEDVKIDKVEDEKEVLSAPKMEEDIPKSESPEPVMESEDNSLVYVIDKEEELPQDHPRFRGPRHPRGGRPIRPRERMQEKEEARIQRIYEEEKEKMEWEEELHHQLQMERWEEERRRAGPGPFRRGMGRGGFPRAPHRDGWDSPPVDDDVDIARGSIRRGPPRPPVGRAPRFPPREREGRHRPPPMMHDDMHGRPPPGFHRGRSPPEHRLPPHPRHPGEPRLPDWDRGHRLPPGDGHFPPERPFHPDERRISPPMEHRPVPLEHQDIPPANHLPPVHHPGPVNHLPPVHHPAAVNHMAPIHHPGPVNQMLPVHHSGPVNHPPQHGDHPPQAVHHPAPVNHPPPINQINVNQLLADLLAKGILPGSKKPEPERSSPVPAPDTVIKTEPPSSNSVPKPVEEPRTISPFDDELLTMDPDANIPVVTLGSDLKIRHDEIIKRLYTGIQCSACGLRFTTRQTDLYAEHLDWHYRVNRKDKEGGIQCHRTLFPAAGEWICFEEVAKPEEKDPFSEELTKGEIPGAEENTNLTVPLTGKQDEDTCKVCHEPFETFYNENDDEWQFANCVKVDEHNFHPSCYEDNNYESTASLVTPIKTPLYNPLMQAIGIPGLDETQVKEEPGLKSETFETPGSLEEKTPENSEKMETTENSERLENSAIKIKEEKLDAIPHDGTLDQPPIQSDTTSELIHVDADTTETISVQIVAKDSSGSMQATCDDMSCENDLKSAENDVTDSKDDDKPTEYYANANQNNVAENDAATNESEVTTDQNDVITTDDVKSTDTDTVVHYNNPSDQTSVKEADDPSVSDVTPAGADVKTLEAAPSINQHLENL